MDVSTETLRKSFREMPDNQLVKRWRDQSFTEDALPIAKAEIEARGLDVSTAAIDRVREEEREQDQAIRRRQVGYAKEIGLSFLVRSGLVGAGILILLGIVLSLFR
ncbi:hypothetical protein ASD78_15460 [Lysobacter sp. Root667]|uniref:hypothetical protein n=1 Tax=Lysobacter sp. Root667 TaxID=1736581 RepID=UPI0006F37213|nr:hypothetical protein [Lysobacter sp. Root667]KRA72998.1 hypothetical protein ASD78_15460 [Lysobacter sp. Root667]